MKPLQQEITPQVAIEQLSGKAGSRPDLWILVWTVQNLSSQALQLFRARLPHSLFYCAEQELNPPRKLEPGESYRLEFFVTCREPPGTVIENAFLILRTEWLQRSWWIFTQLRVIMEDRGPQTITETVTIYPVGFSH